MRVAIIGATSRIAGEVARVFAEGGADLFLVARDEAHLRQIAAELKPLGTGTVMTFLADLRDRARYIAMVEAAGPCDIVLLAHGWLPDQNAIDGDPAAQAEVFDLNATSVIAIGAAFAAQMERANQGVLAVIGSVAGDRARRSNYVYAAAKAGVHAWCEGMQARFAGSGVAVILVKPGWVDTPMTASMKKNFLFDSPQNVARGIHRAIAQRRRTVYLPWFWRWISLVVRYLPARLIRF